MVEIKQICKKQKPDKKPIFIRMAGCDWKRRRKKVNFIPSISPLLMQNSIKEWDLISMLRKNELYGFCLVDIRPTEKSMFFVDINWPPIMKKCEINFDDIPVWMRSNTNEKAFPKTNIVQAMWADNLLLHTELIHFYMKHGFIIKKVRKFYEYQPSECFDNIYRKVYEARAKATKTSKQEGDNLKAQAVKLTSNAMYGRFLMVS